MTNKTKIKIFIVDDDALYLKALEIDFHHRVDFVITTFATGELCVAQLSEKPDVIILDYYLNSVDKSAMNGIDTLDKIIQSDPEIAVIILSGQDKIEVAVDCMHHKAFDYIVKSETALLRLNKTITQIVHTRNIEKALNWYMKKM